MYFLYLLILCRLKIGGNEKMNNVLVVMRSTGQSRAFEKHMDQYIVKENLPINWVYVDDKTYVEAISEKEIKMAILSPEVLFMETKIKADLDAKEIKHLSIKPAAFGLRQTEKFMPEVLSTLGL